MKSRLCPTCGLSSLSESEFLCASCITCEESLTAPAFNTMCDWDSKCINPVLYFCACGQKPVWLCEEHRSLHEVNNPPHLISRIEAYSGVEKFGFFAFKENFLQFIQVRLALSSSQEVLASELRAFTDQREALQAKLVELDEYSATLQRKIARLEELKKELAAKHPIRPVSSILSVFFATDITHNCANLETETEKFIGPFHAFDLNAALDALELRPKGQMQANISPGVERLNLAISLLIHPTAPVSTGARMCFLDDGRLFVCGGPQTKAAFTVLPHTEPVPLPDLRFERESHGIVQYQSTLYVFGGVVDTSTSVKSWEAFSLTSKTWQYGKMSHGRQFFNPGVFKDKIYIAGGHSKYGVEVFDPISHSFASFKGAPQFEIGGVVIGLENELQILFNKKIYRHHREPKTIDQPLELDEEEGMYSIVSPFRDTSGVVYMLLCNHRKLGIAFDRAMKPTFTSYA